MLSLLGNFRYFGRVNLVFWVVGLKVDSPRGYRVDLIVDDRLVVELKSVEHVLKIHEAQLLTYMKLTKIKAGLLMNFNVEIMKQGIKRFVL